MPSTMSSFSTVPGIPPELAGEMQETFDTLVSGGSSAAQARDASYRDVRNAGWYRTSNGWSQLGPDVRDKVNIRPATKQPNGKYHVGEVDVFYPNAVKGASMSFTPEKIDQAVHNTNRSIEAGGQRPSLALEHPHPLRGILGKPAKSVGQCINWRASPRGKGWVRVDLTEVDSETVRDWKAGKYTGLSAGLVNDSDELNLRFGHVALLGVESQALAMLPMTEIFSNHQLCFSADASAYQKGFAAMNEEMRQAFASLGEHHSRLAAAFASAAAEEPGADAKVQEAYSAYDTAQTEFMGKYCDEDEDKNTISKVIKDRIKDEEDPEDDMVQAPDDDTPFSTDLQKVFMQQAPTETSDLPDSNVLDKSTQITGTIANPPGKSEDNAFNTINMSVEARTIFSNQQTQLENLTSQLAQAHTAIQGMAGKQAKSEFDTFCDDLRNKGHQFDQEKAGVMFSACKDIGQMNALKSFLQSSPRTTAYGGPTFGVTGQQSVKLDNATGTPGEEAVQNIVNRALPGMTFSAEDVALGGVLTDIMNTQDSDPALFN